MTCDPKTYDPETHDPTTCDLTSGIDRVHSLGVAHKAAHVCHVVPHLMQMPRRLRTLPPHQFLKSLVFLIQIHVIDSSWPRLLCLI